MKVDDNVYEKNKNKISDGQIHQAPLRVTTCDEQTEHLGPCFERAEIGGGKRFRCRING